MVTIETLPIVEHVLLVVHTVLNEMWIQEDELVILETDEVEGGVWPSSHGAHENVGLRENVADGLYVAGLHLVHADPARYDHEAAIPELSLQTFIAVGLFLKFGLLGHFFLVNKSSKLLFSPGLALYFNIVIKQGLDGFLDVVLSLQRFLVSGRGDGVRLRIILDINHFLHFASNGLEPDHAIVQDAHLEIVTEWSVQSIQLFQNMRHLPDT